MRSLETPLVHVTLRLSQLTSPETALSGRAVCIATECKDAKIKIEQHDLRLGVWVNYEDHGSWKWKHWGCVTGAQIANMREYLLDQATNEYQWGALDGYDGEEKNSLARHPDLQEKVRRVITQGYIDPEDWNGVRFPIFRNMSLF